MFGSTAPETEKRASRRLDVSKADLQVVQHDNLIHTHAYTHTHTKADLQVV